MSVISIIPIQSEKAYTQSLENVYIFEVPLSVNKQQIADAVEAQYGVTVTNVKSLVRKGKAVAFSRGKRARPGITKRSDIKRAYVTLKEGDSIKLFEDEKQEEKGDK